MHNPKPHDSQDSPRSLNMGAFAFSSDIRHLTSDSLISLP